ncbi:MAG TPA: (Fe-S)-binding protein, partial [Frankiaceae bacterium]|nr:(Fe-S)-binding protein [Frankiaceae bacterium]
AAEAGAPLPAAAALRARFAGTGAPRGGPSVAGDATARTVLWLGCPTDGTRTGDAALALFAAAGEPVRCEAAGECCGSVAYDLGLAPEAASLARAAAAGLAGADRVVVASPSCARMMREEWPRLGIDAPPVTTAVEWLASAAPALPLAPATGAVAWHAPCTLTRALGVVEEGPAVLRALGYDVREPAATGIDTRCSGAGAAYPLVDAAGAAAVAAVRRAELAALDAPPVTACASAGRALGAADLLVLAAERLVR